MCQILYALPVILQACKRKQVNMLYPRRGIFWEHGWWNVKPPVKPDPVLSN